MKLEMPVGKRCSKEEIEGGLDTRNSLWIAAGYGRNHDMMMMVMASVLRAPGWWIVCVSTSV